MRYLVAFLLMFDFVLIPLVAVLAVFGKYPYWVLTPDDPESPFGLYEPSMRKLYGVSTFSEKPVWWRRILGDLAQTLLT